jgi:hypothetical protein
MAWSAVPTSAVPTSAVPTSAVPARVVRRRPALVEETTRRRGVWTPAEGVPAGVLRAEARGGREPHSRPARAGVSGLGEGTARPAARWSRPAPRGVEPARGLGNRGRMQPPPPYPERREPALQRRRRRRLPIPRSEGMPSSPSRTHVVAVLSTSATQATTLRETGRRLARSHPEYIRRHIELRKPNGLPFLLGF